MEVYVDDISVLKISVLLISFLLYVCVLLSLKGLKGYSQF